MGGLNVASYVIRPETCVVALPSLTPHLSLKVLVDVVKAGHIRRAVANHQLGQAATEVIDDGLRSVSGGDVTLEYPVK